MRMSQGSLAFVLPILCQLLGVNGFLQTRSIYHRQIDEKGLVSRTLLPALVEDLRDACSGQSVEKLNCEPIFATFATSDEFKAKFWQKEPFHYSEVLPNLELAFTMADVEHAIETDFLEAGRGTFSAKSGWNMAQVSEPTGTTFDEAKLKYNEVTNAMKEKNGTVVFNSAGGFVPELAGVCLQVVNAFQLPCALNMYLTAAGQPTSAPPHTDKQDVFVMQTQGKKHWRVFSPPPPARMPRADPLARGKGMDQLSIHELDPPVIDTVLSPGNILYIPAGYPHTTDTIEGISEDSDPSVHLTVGVDTHIWGLNYASLRENVLKKVGLKDKQLLPKLNQELYWSLQSSLPFGFLCENAEDVTEDPLADLLLEKMKLTDAKQSESIDKSTVIACITKLKAHHREITDLFGRMYSDVCMKISLNF